MKTIHCCLALLFMATLSYAQMLPITDHTLISTSENIIKGTVISTDAKWVNNDSYIYTFTKIKIDNVFLGKYKKGDIVTIVTPGGYDRVKDIGMGVSNQATFDSGEEAVIYLVKAKGEIDAVDYSFLKNDSSIPTDIMRVNGYYQGKHKVIHDQRTGKAMVAKSNENKVVELSIAEKSIKTELKKARK